MSDLTAEQIAFVQSPLKQDSVLIAAAGSGKTLSVVERVKFLVHNGIPKDEILCLSYTRAAAWEIVKRKAPCVSRTIHSATMRELAAHGYKPLPAMKLIGNALGHDLTGYDHSIVAEITGGMINAANKAFGQREPLKTEMMGKNAKMIYEHMRKEGVYAMEFAPFLFSALAAENGLREKKDYSFIIVDEAQDINSITYLGLTYLARHADGKKMANISMVGDYRQAIYSFCGGKTCFMEAWQERKGSQTYELTKSFRYPLTISEAVNAEFSLDTKTEKGGGAYDRISDNEVLAVRIKSALAADKSACVIVATHSKKEAVRKWLKSKDIPVFGDKPVGKTKGFSLLLQNFDAIKSGARLPNPKLITDEQKALIDHYCLVETRQRDAFIWNQIRGNKLPATIKRIADEVSAFFDGDPDMTIEFLGNIELPQKENRVKITTAHSVKGEEYDLVAWVDCGDAFYDPNMFERYNLIYVICTRAKEQMIIMEWKDGRFDSLEG